ncbi:hypothetical protein [Streptacidiphilus melanogenes]|uniref:hypothetical protein n=1 Tax=Streptacidiphilus melanogenes TaxID=411235 RepID=UPI0005A6B865|nr:hypothetical protein [Streptacidiphilus melanogenes]
MRSHQDTLLNHAEQLGLPIPLLFLDNGIPSSRPRPALGHLMALTDERLVTVLLIPGTFVFSLYDAAARAIAARFAGAGCRLVDLLHPRKAALIPAAGPSH